MGFDAVAVGHVDLSAGPQFFQSLANSDFPWVSSNIYYDTGELAFSPYRIKKAGSLTVGIIGITGTNDRVGQLPGYRVGDWQEGLSKQLDSLTEECDLILLLSNLDNKQNKEVTSIFPQIDIVITGDKRRGNVPPKLSNNSLSTQVSNRGRYMGQLDIAWSPRGMWNDPSLPSISQLEKRVESYDKNTLRLKDKLKQATPSQAEYITKNLERIVRQKNAIEATISSRKKLEKTIITQNLPTNTFSYSVHKVVPTRQVPEVDELVAQIKSNIENHNKAKRKKALNPEEKAILQLDKIAGYKVCMECHEPQADFWEQTKHSRAFSTLEESGQSYNTDCLPCHVTTGFVDNNSSDDDKFLLLTLKEHRQTIGCESCHGPALLHSQSPDLISPQKTVPKKVCLPCHTVEMDRTFNFKEQVGHVACPPTPAN